jgi:prolyl-tRNA editing enzyme YbaK/EbsC (Cys-tRNA(Pro) deacylase)
MCIQWIGMIARNKEQRVVKTNAVRVLDRLAIKYDLREYEVDPQDLSAEAVAAKIGLPPEQLFKTLAVRGGGNGIYLAVISVLTTHEYLACAMARQAIELNPRSDSF